MREAYECKPCKVVLKQLTSEEIARIIRKLKEQSASITKPKPKPPVQQQVEQMRQEQRRDDGVFKPPVPIPVKEFEIETMDDDGEFRPYCTKIYRYFNMIFVFISVHQHQMRIRMEHSYSR